MMVTKRKAAQKHGRDVAVRPHGAVHAGPVPKPGGGVGVFNFIDSEPRKQQPNADPRAPKLPRPFPIKALWQGAGRTSGERYFLLDPDHPSVGALTDEERWDWVI